MDKRVALVTGSARGLGRAIAVALVASGHSVVGVDVIDQGLGPLTRVFKADLAGPAAIDALLAMVGRVDVLVNNAAVLVEKSIEDTSVAEFDLTIAVNLRAPFLLSRGCGGSMRARGWGRIINIASIAARTGGVSQVAAYGASKAGLVALTKNFARNYGPDGVTVNAITPGAIQAPMAESQESRNPGMLAATASAIPLRRIGLPVEVAAAVTFLASDGASFITGATIDINGGLVMY